MHSVEPLIIGAEHPTRGAAAAAQGVYGTRGNLELVTCDIADGLWVFWFNSDLDTDPLAAAEVPPGSWSAGLHFAAGTGYTAAQILQVRPGPHHLEVLALTTDRVLESWYWSAGPGFQKREQDVATEVAAFVATATTGTEIVDDTLVVHCDDPLGERYRVTATAAGYPHRAWTQQPASRYGPLIDAATAERTLLAAGIPRDSIAAGTARAATSTRHGGTHELTYRDAAGALRHLAVPARPLS